MTLKTRAKQEYKDCFPYLLHLLSCVLNGTKPVPPEEDVDWNSLLRLSEFHSVAGMLSYAVNLLPIDKRPKDDVNNLFRHYQGLSLVAESNVAIETESLLNILSSAGVRVLPVKGYVLKNDYPIPAMRSMTDVDIIYDANKKQQVKEVFSQRGYDFSEVGGELNFAKGDLFHYELHASKEKSEATKHTCFSDVLSRAVYSDNSLVGSLSNEDFYVFVLNHLARHFTSGGAGVRMVMDVYVFCKAHYAELDKSFLHTELENMGLVKFEEVIRELAYNWFSGGVPDTDSFLADYILCACTFGVTRDAFIQSAIKEESKTGKKSTPAKAFMRKIFPQYKYIAEIYPIAEKHKIMYPFCVIAQWCDRIFRKRNINTKNLKYYMASTESEDAQRLRLVMKEAGLSFYRNNGE